eukprot:CAMPEP_0172163658 /NCGR_PEP_ID=MMETSP1050-20130122/7394_1 /TAXON_ID=233186 /ORGANISM="Cryptomonas curvata, Strain CCAP979/52" /LENGTH=74 /DNA_ID=CAMNT_0012833873 /DNA_START=382 /DNA_END=603 /DNA_ORIENTATION=+
MSPSHVCCMASLLVEQVEACEASFANPHPRFKSMARFLLKHQSSLMLAAMLLSSALDEEIMARKSYQKLPSDPK